MRHTKGVISSLLFLLILFALPNQGLTQTIIVDPMDLYFADVLLGDTSTQVFKITSGGPTPLTIDPITIVDAADHAEFSFLSFTYSEPSTYHNLPDTTVMLPEDYVDIELLFAPTLIGVYEAELYIQSDAVLPDNELYLNLFGRGVSTNSIPEPSTILLIGSGLIGLVGFRRKFRKK